MKPSQEDINKLRRDAALRRAKARRKDAQRPQASASGKGLVKFGCFLIATLIGVTITLLILGAIYG